MRLEGLVEAMSQARKGMKQADFGQACRTLNKSRNALRETMQAETSDQIRRVVVKLRREGAVLSSEELTLVRAWIVGDAESYKEMERDLQTWLSEFERLESVIGSHEQHKCSVQELAAARGVIVDAMRIGYDIAHYLEKKERVEMFDESMKDVEKLNRKALANVLERKLTSDDQ